MAHSQRSSRSTPRFHADATALAKKFRYVSSTGFGAAVVPEVWITAKTASGSSSSRSGTSASSPVGRSRTTSRAPAVGGSASRVLSGTSTAPSRGSACISSANAIPGRSGWVRALRESQSSRGLIVGARMATTQEIRPALDWQPAGEYEDIRYEIAEGVAKITITRPEVRNAFRPQTVIEMSDALDRAREDLDVGVIILTGEGPLAFCSGGDQRVRGDSGYMTDDQASGSRIGRFHVTDLQVQIRRTPKPVVAMVAGYAIGGGHVLHIVCDL